MAELEQTASLAVFRSEWLIIVWPFDGCYVAVWTVSLAV